MSTAKAKKPAPKKPAAKAAAPKKAAPKKVVSKKAAAAKPAPRADYGQPIDTMIQKQPEPFRALLEELRALILEAAPEATAQLKWGMPNFAIGKSMMCALGAHKSHVNLILSGPPGTYADPKGLLEPEGKTGRHLKLTASKPLPRAEVKGWLKAAARHARGG